MPCPGRLLKLLLLSAALLLGRPGHAGEALAPLNEILIREPATALDWLGRPTQGEILITVFRPPGAGPFPLVVINHGRDARQRAATPRFRFETASRYFLSRGFAVAIPTRLGYGDSARAGDPENISPRCPLSLYEPALDAARQQIAQSVRRLHAEAWIDPQRLLLLGQSLGGLGSLASSALELPGLRATINFAGGHGGDAERHPGRPCNPDALTALFRDYGQETRTPSLWLYTENDRYFAPELARQWHSAYTAAGGRAELKLLPAFGDNGHQLFSQGKDIWQPIVDDYLLRLGLYQPHRIVARQQAPQDG